MKKTRYLAVLLVLAFTVAGALVGCQSSDSNATAAPQGTATAKATNAPTEAPTSPASTDNELYEFTIFANFSPVEESDADIAFWGGLEEALNLKINFEIPPSGNYAERKQIMLAGGSYPELVLFDSTSDKAYLDSVRNGIVLPLNDYLDNAPNIMQYSYDVSFDSLKTMNDDNIYGVPRTSVARADGFLMRSDWLENVGITDVQDGSTITRDKLTEILTAFTRNDPDGNGADDTYGVMVYADANGNMGPQFAWSFGLIGWQDYDGEYMDLQYSQTHDNYKKALEYTAMLWQEGLLDPDWPTLNSEVANERMTNGVYGMRGEFAGWLISSELAMQEINPDAKLIYLTGIEDENGVVVGGSFSTGFWGQWCIMQGAEKPERIIQMLDYSLSDDYWDAVKFGPEGVTWNDESGVKTPTDAYADYKWGRAFVRRNDDPDFFVTLNMTDENRTRLNNLIGVCIENAVFSMDQGYRPAAADDQAFIDYQTEMSKTISKIIVGDLPVSAWDEALQGWYDAGGSQYVQQMQEYITAREGE